MRNLTKTLAVVSILAPASAYPLGIGDIKLHSALNQNLNAEITLQLSGENVSDIKVNLAPPEKFDEAGVAWNYFLSKIKFETITRPNGSVVIKLTSREALKEPFLDLLLEVTWPKGNLYREFTVLVDPPSVYNQATIPVSTSTQNYAAEPLRSSPQSALANNSGGTDQYGPTRKNDTLWRVAEGLSREQGVSVEQMMMALYQANPDAFYQDSVHALMAGKTLKVPEKEVILRLSRSQALAEFNKQTNVWKNRLSSAAAKPPVVKQAAAADNQLKLIAPTEASVADAAVVAPGNDQVTSEKKSPAAPADLDANKGKETSAASPADTAIQTKIAALEQQLAVMQQLITLKDQQLAAIQNQTQQIQGKPATQEQAKQAIPTESPENLTQTAPEPVLHPVVETPVAAPISEPVIESLPAKVPAQAQDAVASKPTVQPAAKPPVAQPKAIIEESNDIYYFGIGGVGAAVFGLLGWLWWRKRNVEEETGTESVFASSSLIKVPEEEDVFSVPIVADSAAYTVGESSFLSEFTPSDFNSFDTDQGEIDPISEADVYLAYGRYQQAEELMRHAITDFPDRDECKLKLLEIYYASENKQAFSAYANELAQTGKNKQVDFWAKVAEMGEELCSDDALFLKGGAHFANKKPATEDTSDTNSAHAEELDFDLISFEKLSVKDKTPPVEKSKESALDYDLTSFELEDDTLVDEDRNNQDIDFDLSAFENETVKMDDIDKLETSNNIDDLETFEFNFDTIKTEAVPKEKPSLISSEQKITPAAELSLDESLTFDSDDFDFSFDMDDADSESFNSSRDDKFGVSDLTDMDELETKLDLAKAYVDMGDMGAARDIASEVLTKGSDAQKAAAQELLDDLS